MIEGHRRLRTDLQSDPRAAPRVEGGSEAPETLPGRTGGGGSGK